MLVNGDVIVLDGTYHLFQPTLGPIGPTAFQVIPRLENIVERVIDSFSEDPPATDSGLGSHLVINVGTGLRCGSGIARLAARRLHEAIVESLGME